MASPQHPLPASVQAALERGDKLLAIKLLRASSGVDLRAAQQAIEQGGLDTLIPPDVAEPALLQLPPAVRDALQRGRTVEAIRLLRAATGMGLKQAKDAVDAVSAENPRTGHGPGPGEVPRARWGMWLLLLAVLSAVAAYRFWYR